MSGDLPTCPMCDGMGKLSKSVQRRQAIMTDAEIAALRAERDALRLSLDESVKELSRTVQQMNELNRSYAELKAHSTGNLTVTMRERDRLQQQIDALTREAEAALAAPDEAEVERVAKATVGDWDALAYYMQESYRILARAAIAAFIAGRKS